MRYHEIERVIRATPGEIWAVLTDAQRLADGSFSILKIEGEIVEGRTIKLWSEVDPKRAFPIQVSKCVPEREMVWQNGLPLGLFQGVRRFELTQVDGGTRFRMREDYTGPLAGLMVRLIPDLTPSFEKFADGLAKATETT